MRDLSPAQKRQIMVQGWTNKQTQIASNKVTKGDEGSPSLPKESDLWTNDSTGVDIRQTIIQTNKQTQNKGDKRGDEGSLSLSEEGNSWTNDGARVDIKQTNKQTSKQTNKQTNKHT